MEQTLEALETCFLGLLMCIYVPSVELHSWEVVLENSIWSLKSPVKMVAIFCMNPATGQVKNKILEGQGKVKLYFE